MRLRKIHAQDFLSFGALDLDVGPALTFVTGPNGVGKTNLGRCVDVIYSALAHFGDTAAALAWVRHARAQVGGGEGSSGDPELADLLQAEMDIDPLLRHGHAIADPGVLVTPTGGKRARISVISFIGLTVDQRQGFVGQLELALFNWVKQHPAAAGSLGWLLVIDEAQNYAPQLV
jgi:hypothetical protein